MEEAVRKGRLMPILDLEGKRFFVDIRMQEMRQVDNFMNAVSFDSLGWSFTDNRPRLVFDHKTNQPYTGNWDARLPAHVADLHLPYLHAWHTPATQEYYASQQDYRAGKQLPEVTYATVSKSGLKKVAAEISDLPKKEIDGTLFIIDQAKQELRQANNPSNAIGFRHLQKQGDEYLLLYDRMYKNALGTKNHHPHMHVEEVRFSKQEIGEIIRKQRKIARDMAPDTGQQQRKKM